MTACVAEAEPLKSHLAAVLAIAMFNTLIFRATPATMGFAVAGMDQVIPGMLCTILSVGNCARGPTAFAIGCALR